jgi:hypothetical protein
VVGRRASTWRRIGMAIAMTFAATTSSLALAAAPASAWGAQCNPDVPQDQAYFKTCIFVDSDGDTYGMVRWYYSDGYFTSAVVYVRQCRVDLNPAYCGTFAANSGSGTNVVTTRPKPAAYGHVYQACASISVKLQGHIYSPWATNCCSGWRSWP